MAVRLRSRDGLVRDRPARAWTVLDDDRLPQALGHLLRDHARRDVARAARRGSEDYTHGFDGIRLPRRVHDAESEARYESSYQFPHDPPHVISHWSPVASHLATDRHSIVGRRLLADARG